MARVVRFHQIGAPEVLQIDELPLPQPAPNEVRLAVAAIGLNRVESMFRSGGFIIPALPSKIGYEAAGTIDAVGSAVTNFAVGDRVATLPGLSMEQYGTYGESIVYPADMLVKIPHTQSMVDAAASWMQYLTAYGLVALAQIKRGDVVVITAASSSVGLAAIQIANAAGATPIAVTRGPDKIDALKKYGAAHVVVSNEQDVANAVRKITHGRGANIVFDAVGGQQLGVLLGALAPHGIAIVYGSLGGIEVTLPLHSVMLNGLTVRGFAANELLADPALRRNAIAYISAGIDSGALRPVVDRVFTLRDIVDAHRHLESNSQTGKIIVTVDR